MFCEKQISNACSVFLAPPVRFTNKSDLLEVVTCSAQATAQLTAEVSDYDTQVCDGEHTSILALLLAFTDYFHVPLILQVCRGEKKLFEFL